MGKKTEVLAFLPLPTTSSPSFSWSDPNPISLNIIDYGKSLIGGKTLPRKPESELHVYSRRENYHDKQHQPMLINFSR